MKWTTKIPVWSVVVVGAIAALGLVTLGLGGPTEAMATGQSIVEQIAPGSAQASPSLPPRPASVSVTPAK